MSKAYVIGEVEFEYNDEIMHTPEGEGVTPKRVFTSRERAEAEAERLNIDLFRRISPGHYTYDMDDILKYHDIDEAWQEICRILGLAPADDVVPEPTIDYNFRVEFTHKGSRVGETTNVNLEHQITLEQYKKATKSSTYHWSTYSIALLSQIAVDKLKERGYVNPVVVTIDVRGGNYQDNAPEYPSNPFEDYNDWSVPKNATDEQVKQIYDLFDLRFYKVYEVECD